MPCHQQATATLQDKIRLVGSCERSSISSDGSSSGATGAELKDIKMKSVGEFSSPEEMVRHMMQRAMKASIEQRKRLLITNAFVCLTLIPRCVFVIFVAISNFNNKMDPDCAACDTCQTIGRVLTEYLYATPESYLGVSCLSSTLPLGAALWGMLSRKDRRLLRTNVVDKNQSLEGGASLVSKRMNISLPL